MPSIEFNQMKSRGQQLRKCVISRDSARLRKFFGLVVPFLLLFFLLSPGSAFAATIYIDGNSPENCSGNYSVGARNCSGSDGDAYTSVSSGISAASAGDTIYVRSGTYTIDSSIDVNFSSDTLTTTIQAYNSESVTLHRPQVAGPIFNLSTDSTKNITFKDLKFTSNTYEVLTGWTNYSGNVWSTSSSYVSTQVRFDTTNGTNAGSLGAVDTANEYYYDATTDTLYVYSVGDPDTTYTSPGINLADNFNGIAIGNPSRNAAGNLITIDNCEFEGFSHVGVKGTWRWHVKNSKFSNIGTDSNDHHIYPTGVQTSGSEMVFEHNYFGYTPGAAIHLFSSPAYAIVRHNVFNGLSGSARASHGVLVQGSHHQVYNNTIYGHVRGVTLRQGSAQDNIIKNSIFSNNTNDLNIDTGGGSYPTNNTVETNYFGSNTKCSGCNDFTGSGGPDLSALDDSPPNTYSTSPWTYFSVDFTVTGGYANVSFVPSQVGTWYLDDLSIKPIGGGSEMLTNGDMEGTFSSGIASGWHAYSGVTGSQELTIVHGGSSSQELTNTGGSGSRYEQAVSFTAGTYTLSGWAKKNSGTGTLTVNFPLGGGTSAFSIGNLGPSFLGALPYSSATDFKIDPTGTDAALVINSGENLGTSYQYGWDSSASSWPLNIVSQDSYGNSWDMGAFIYTTTPTTTDNVDSSWHSDDVTVTLNCSESGGTGCANTYYTTDGSTPTTSSSFGNNFTLTNDGIYTIKYFSVDTLGNQEAVKTASNLVKIDKTSPSKHDLISPTGFTRDSIKPTLRFKKSTDSASGVASYTVTLDTAKNRSFSTSDIPASGNGTANYVWKNDDEVKIVFVNENDSDPSNDEIQVYFKGLDAEPLSEGRHTWTVTTYDSTSNPTSNSADFYIDKTTPLISELALANNSTVSSGASYNLGITNRMPAFSGLATDIYQGSTITNSNGTKDAFEKVSSGPKTITLQLKKLKSGQNAADENPEYEEYLTKDYSLSDIKDDSGSKKSGRFYFTIPYPLLDGYYQVKLTLTDQAGNTYDHPVFYLSLDSRQSILKTLLPDRDLEAEIVDTKVTRKAGHKTETVKDKEGGESDTEPAEVLGVDVRIKVVDENKEAVLGATVTLHSTPRETTTDQDGIAYFKDVEPGEHRVVIAYNGQTGDQKINIRGDSDVDEIDFTIQIKTTSPFLDPLVMGVVATLALVILLVSVLFIRGKASRARID